MLERGPSESISGVFGKHLSQSGGTLGNLNRD
jgi:hypothetical protein